MRAAGVSAFRVLPGLLVAGLAAALAVPGSRAAVGEEGEGKADGAAAASRLFAAQCASCHAAPDPARGTDRAWIDQVHRTA